MTRSGIASLLAAIALTAGCTGSSTDDPNSRPTETTAVAVSVESTGTTSPPAPATTSTVEIITPAPTTAPSIAVPTTAGPPTNTPAPIEPVDVTTDDGRITVGGELPADVDPLVAVPDDFEISIGSFTDLSAGVAGSSKQTLDDLTDFYVSALRAETGNEPVVEHITDQITRITVSAGSAAATVVLGPGPTGTTSITIDVTR